MGGMTAPVDDLVEHEHEDCVCGPLLIPVVTGEGERTEIEIHRRLDGRENGVNQSAAVPPST